MPNKPSALKRLRQNVKQRSRNRTARSAMKTAIKNVEEAVTAGDAGVAKTSLKKAVSIINRTSQKGIIHDNKASRLTSRLTKKVNATAAPEEPGE